MIGYWIGWLGVLLGICVPFPQLLKIFRHEPLTGVALGTYAILELTLAFYLWHAIYIGSLVFTVAQSVNLVSNGTILFFLIRRRDG